MPPRHQRRRALRVLAAAAGLALLPGPRTAQVPLRHRWRGAAMGAEARIDLWTEDRDGARRLIRLCLAEIDRLERLFSLQRTDSALSALNRDGHLPRPPLELVSLLGTASRMAALSGGAFDVTVQPLWRLYAEHFLRPGCDPAGPDPRELEAVRRLVDHAAVEVAPGSVRLARRGMALTLNGIAQGFVADRLAALLQEEGLASVLLDVGEIATVGPPPGGGSWRVRAGSAVDAPVLRLERGAVATSSPAALTFDPAGRLPHLLDPATLRPCRAAAEVTVVAESAAIADALSTALAVRPALQLAGARQGVHQIVRRPIAGETAAMKDGRGEA